MTSITHHFKTYILQLSIKQVSVRNIKLQNFMNLPTNDPLFFIQSTPNDPLFSTFVSNFTQKMKIFARFARIFRNLTILWQF